MNRQRLPDRRACSSFEFECAGHRYTATIEETVALLTADPAPSASLGEFR
jgi:hypothetical protein